MGPGFFRVSSDRRSGPFLSLRDSLAPSCLTRGASLPPCTPPPPRGGSQASLSQPHAGRPLGPAGSVAGPAVSPGCPCPSRPPLPALGENDVLTCSVSFSLYLCWPNVLLRAAPCTCRWKTRLCHGAGSSSRSVCGGLRRPPHGRATSGALLCPQSLAHSGLSPQGQDLKLFCWCAQWKEGVAAPELRMRPREGVSCPRSPGW